MPIDSRLSIEKGRAIGVIGVDTFQSPDCRITAEEARQRAEAFRRNHSGSLKEMVRALFHPDADPAIAADAEGRMVRRGPADFDAVVM